MKKTKINLATALSIFVAANLFSHNSFACYSFLDDLGPGEKNSVITMIVCGNTFTTNIPPCTADASYSKCKSTSYTPIVKKRYGCNSGNFKTDLSCEPIIIFQTKTVYWGVPNCYINYTAHPPKCIAGCIDWDTDPNNI